MAIDGETMETVTDFILGGSKITADSDCSHEIKRCLLLGRKVMTNLLLSRFSRVRLCATPEMAAYQAPPSLGFSRQEHWSGLPLHPYMTARKTIALTRWTFVSKVISLLFNMLSRLVIVFLPRSKQHFFVQLSV